MARRLGQRDRIGGVGRIDRVALEVEREDAIVVVRLRRKAGDQEADGAGAGVRGRGGQRREGRAVGGLLDAEAGLVGGIVYPIQGQIAGVEVADGEVGRRRGLGGDGQRVDFDVGELVIGGVGAF